MHGKVRAMCTVQRICLLWAVFIKQLEGSRLCNPWLVYRLRWILTNQLAVPLSPHISPWVRAHVQANMIESCLLPRIS
jgi:hypothetical protein